MEREAVDYGTQASTRPGLEPLKVRDTSGQDVVLDPAQGTRKRRRSIVLALCGGGAVLVGLILIVRSWAHAGLTVPRERVRIATVTRGTFVRDIAAEGTVVVANSPTLFAVATGTIAFAAR